MRYLFFTIFIFVSGVVLAQAPQGFTYQGVATNNEGIEISNQDISIRVSFLLETASGNSVYLETHSTTTDAFGLFNVVIGSGQTESDFSTIDWGSSAHFLKVELDVNGGNEYIHIGTQQIMSVPYALYAESINMDSVSNYLTNDSSFMANVGSNENQVESSDFENQTTNSDFNNNVTTQIPLALDGKKVIIYSTSKAIYLTDSVGSFLSVLYSVENNIIGNLTSNDDGDTLYFLQSANNYSAPNIMMTSINDINPVVIGSVPCWQYQLRQFKYFNGNFYYLKNHDLIEISEGSPTVLSSSQENYSFCIDSSGIVYRARRNQNTSFLIDGTSYYSSNYNRYIYDVDVSEFENRLYIWKEDNGGQISYWDLNSNSETILFEPFGAFEASTGLGEQVVRYHDGFVYFNQGKSLFSVQNDGSNSRIISSSNDEYNINGIVPLVFNYQNVNISSAQETINVEDYIASNKKKIFYSTSKAIYLTDSVGSFLSVLYSVENNIIGNLTSNDDGDTLYFLQSANNYSAPNIMMTSINDINPVVIGSVPCWQYQLRQFKYFNGNFYYLKNHDLIEISEGSPTVLSSSQENYSFCIDSSGIVYRARRNQNTSFLIDGTSYYSSNYNRYIYDVDVSEFENRLYIWKEDNGGQISYWDLNSNSETILFEPFGAFEASTGLGEQVVRYHDGFVYFNQGKSLFSVQNDGSNSRIISSSNDEYNINGVVIVD